MSKAENDKQVETMTNSLMLVRLFDLVVIMDADGCSCIERLGVGIVLCTC